MQCVRQNDLQLDIHRKEHCVTMSKNRNSSFGDENSPERESVSIRHLDKEYAEDYRRWRSENSNSYGFFYRSGKDEYTYQDGIGFIDKTPEITELTSLYNVNRLISNIVMLYFIMITVLPIFLPKLISDVTGADIGFDIISRAYYGNSRSVLIYRYITEIIEKLIPIAITGAAAKMSLKVMFPMKISNPPLFGICIPSALLIAAAGSMFIIPSSVVLAGLGIDTSQSVLVSGSAGTVAFTVILLVVITPLLNELIIHGTMLQLLRQFGDGYALVVTSVITAVCTEDIRTAVYYFVLSAVIGYFTLRTGSVITAVVMRSVVSLYFVIQSYIPLAVPENIALTASMGFILLCLIIGMVTVITFLIKNNHKISLPFKETYLSNYEKIMCFFTNPMVITLAAMSLALMILTAPIKL